MLNLLPVLIVLGAAWAAVITAALLANIAADISGKSRKTRVWRWRT